MPHRLTITLASLATILSLALLAPQALRNNAWSIAYARGRVGGLGQSVADPPASHGSAGIWLAQDALAQGDTAKALAFLENPGTRDNRIALSLRGQALAAAGESALAVESWAQARDTRSLWDFAAAAANGGELEAARAALWAAWRLDPEKGTVVLAEFLWGKGDDQLLAMSVLRRAIDWLPDSRFRNGWRNRLGQYLRSLARWHEAVAVYQAALERDPLDWQAWIGLGWARYGQGDGVNAALDCFRQAIVAAPERGDGQYATATLLSKENRYSGADVWYQAALSKMPDSEGWYVARANTARAAGDLALAISVYEEAMARFPDYASVFYEAAWTYKLADDPENAVLAIEKALALIGQSGAGYWVRAGLIYEWTGDPTRAESAYRTALGVSPGHDGAIKGLERLGVPP